MHPSRSFYFLYGPPGSGKSTLGQALAQTLALPFFDLDSLIETGAGKTIPEIFANQGEAGFRRIETHYLEEMLREDRGVIALGGGSLLDPRNRKRVEAAGSIVCLDAAPDVLRERTRAQNGARPLLGTAEEMDARLTALLQARRSHYASFPLRLDSSQLDRQQAVWGIQRLLGAFRVHGMGTGYDVRIQPGGLDDLGNLLRERAASSLISLVSDDHVGPLYSARAASALEACGFSVHAIQIPAGEANKTLATISHLWEAFLACGLERSSSVVALGGGVVTDLAGFAAATYLRGVPWIAVPTTLLSMTDASLGGKTGADLPQGKNLIGAFYPPELVLADPDVLDTLPVEEIRSGLGEVVKHGILADPGLFERCAQGWDALSQGGWSDLVRQAMAVKIRYLEEDPYEKGARAALNLGHTVGHAVERASGYTLRHGEAVAIGMVAEARLAERMGLAEPGLSQTIASVLTDLGLPTRIPGGMDEATLRKWMQVDKKKAGGAVRFALPLRIGEVQTGIAVDLDRYPLLEEHK